MKTLDTPGRPATLVRAVFRLVRFVRPSVGRSTAPAGVLFGRTGADSGPTRTPCLPGSGDGPANQEWLHSGSGAFSLSTCDSGSRPLEAPESLFGSTAGLLPKTKGLAASANPLF